MKPHLEDVKQLRRAGAKYSQIAKELGISLTTLKNYREAHEEFAQALADEELNLRTALANVAEDGLFTKLRDRFIDEVVVREVIDKQNEVRELREVKTRFVPADTTAIIWALKNRLPTQWNKDEHELSILRGKKIEADIHAESSSEDLGKMIQDRLAGYGDSNE
ncbi:hypothetical protein H9L19_06780 [Weissella diestrammenae]|uniref:Uncharacterized protein n=1 Tax=Weissella diestrammenae TaxID=1162633 RepID=A0A7G9T4Q1_9LACO|nr:hypothetical protein [Weissella diestrammenae]MCM0582783.1 hypothetical protein [Weissella diestrammenae]QNN75076.1 hypothetical protein H9L19_06780 [Weissella diestrammenae]